MIIQNNYYYNIRYTKSFIQDYRYGKTNKRLPAGIWFKNNLVDESSNQYKNIHAILTTGYDNSIHLIIYRSND